MIFLAAFILTISAVDSFPFDSRDCFEHSEMNCMENFVDAVFYSNRGVDECNELLKFVECSTDAVDECFGDERNSKVDKGLEELENLSKDTCGAVNSGDNSDFDEETYSHFQLTATIKKKKKASHSRTHKETSVSPHSKNCFGERKKICWDTFENAVIHSVFYSSTGVDKCSVLRHFVLCSSQAADDCFGDEHDEDADELLEVWENKSKEFCEADIKDDKPVTVVVPSIREDQAKNEIQELLKVLSEKYEGSFDVSKVRSVAINTTGLTHPPPRKDNCMIRELEEPVFLRASTEEVGAWFQDAMPTDETEYKYYSTLASDTTHLYEYYTGEAFRDDARRVIYELPFPFTGTGHLVYNGSIYYHEANTQFLARSEFRLGTGFAKRIEDASYNDEHYLYSSELGYMDVMADENGLWVVYSAKDTNNTLVRKLHPYTLATEYMWNLTLPHRRVGEMFIACGVLYAVDSVTAPSTRIRFAFDLYQNKVLEVDIPFSKTFTNISMIAYNPKRGKIFTWDKGHQLEYPILFGIIDIEQPERKEDYK